MDRLTELLRYWNNSLPEKVDYADLVCAPAFARGYRMVYEDEYGYMVEETIKALEELQQYRRAEENGLLLRLPCKVGDELYILTTDSLTGIEETKCKRIVVKKTRNGVKAKIIAPCMLDDWGGAFRELYNKDFGRIAFPTREEAEAKLAEMEGKNAKNRCRSAGQ